MRESTIEQAVCAYAKSRGCLSLKLSGQNQKGQPDRMFLNNERILFIEFKAHGKKLTALQTRWLDRLHYHGFLTACCDDINAGKRLIDLISS